MRYSVRYLVAGLIVIVLIVFVAIAKNHKNSAFDVSPSSGPEGTAVTVTIPAPKTPLPANVKVQFFDAGEHGYVAVNNGAAAYLSYDAKTNNSYAADATLGGSDAKHVSYTALVPGGICGLIIRAAQAKPAAPKALKVSLVGSDGKKLAGDGNFGVKCDSYILKMTVKSSKDPVLPDGVDSSTVTANLSVTGPAQFVNGVRVKPGDQKIVQTTPLGLVMVNFHTSLGNLAQGNPADIKTDLAGDASVDVSSPDAGIAKVFAQASGIGDAQINARFPPKLTGVKQDFVQPNSPTNYAISTIPQNPKDLTVDWKFLPAPGNSCGRLTGPASGMGLVSNGFFHGPADGFPDGCPVPWEMASSMRVTVTDKDGQSDAKTFSARGLEGQGLVKLP